MTQPQAQQGVPTPVRETPKMMVVDELKDTLDASQGRVAGFIRGCR